MSQTPAQPYRGPSPTFPRPYDLCRRFGSRTGAPPSAVFAGGLCRRKSSYSRTSCTSRTPSLRRSRLTLSGGLKRSITGGTSSSAAAGAHRVPVVNDARRGRPLPLNTTTASATHRRTLPFLRLHLKPAGDAPPSPPEPPLPPSVLVSTDAQEMLQPIKNCHVATCYSKEH